MIDETKNKDGVEERSKALLQAYRNRLDYVKQAWMFEHKGEFGHAILSYEKYFEILARYHRCEKEDLLPPLFKKITDDENEKTKNEDDVHEIFLLSQVFWNLAKIYAKSDDKTHVEKCKHMVDQFVIFSTGYKFQYLNCDTCRKYLKNVNSSSLEYFEQAYQKLKIHSKSCYIATWCYQVEHPDLEIFRSFRDKIYYCFPGKKLVDFYYSSAPPIVRFLAKHYLFGRIARRIIRPIFNLLANIMRHFII